MDWLREKRKIMPPRPRGISLDELAKHVERNDAWLAIRGKVYNITPYLDFHPAGTAQIMRGAGKVRPSKRIKQKKQVPATLQRNTKTLFWHRRKPRVTLRSRDPDRHVSPPFHLTISLSCQTTHLLAELLYSPSIPIPCWHHLLSLFHWAYHPSCSDTLEHTAGKHPPLPRSIMTELSQLSAFIVLNFEARFSLNLNFSSPSFASRRTGRHCAIWRIPRLGEHRLHARHVSYWFPWE